MATIDGGAERDPVSYYSFTMLVPGAAARLKNVLLTKCGGEPRNVPRYNVITCMPSKADKALKLGFGWLPSLNTSSTLAVRPIVSDSPGSRHGMSSVRAAVAVAC